MYERIWKIMGRKLRYSADEIRAFRARGENLDILAKATQINDLEIVAKVVSARGCNSGHDKGQEIVMDGAGNLQASKIPQRTCIFLMGNLPSFVYGVHELLYAGVEPDDICLRINRTGCADVGVENCGWGRVIVEISVRKRRPEAAL